MHSYSESANLPLLKVNMRSVFFRRQIQRNKHDGENICTNESYEIGNQWRKSRYGKVHTTILRDAVSVAEQAFYWHFSTKEASFSFNFPLQNLSATLSFWSKRVHIWLATSRDFSTSQQLDLSSSCISSAFRIPRNNHLLPQLHFLEPKIEIILFFLSFW